MRYAEMSLTRQFFDASLHFLKKIKNIVGYRTGECVYIKFQVFNRFTLGQGGDTNRHTHIDKYMSEYSKTRWIVQRHVDLVIIFQ